MPSNEESVATKLKRIAEKARKDPQCRFTSLFHLMSYDLLWERRKFVGEPQRSC
jgi:hypothetical protein